MIRFEINYPGLITSSSLEDFNITTDYDYLDLVVADKAGNVLLSERFWAFGGKVTLTDVASLIEIDLRSKGISIDEYHITASWTWEGDESDESQPVPEPGSRYQTAFVNLKVLYCQCFNITDENFYEYVLQNFLTTLQMRRLPADFLMSVPFFSEIFRENFEVAINYRVNDNPEILRFSYSEESLPVSNEIYEIRLSQKDMLERIKASSTVAGSVEIVSFSVACGARYLSCFIDKSLGDGQTFMFRNIFNAWDYFTFPALTTAKTDVSRSLAVMPQKSVFYDKAVTKSFDVETGPVDIPEAEFLGELAASLEVYRYVPLGLVDGFTKYAVKEVLVTESDIQYKDNERLQSVKFTWRYADNRAPVILDLPYRIFTDEFNKVYS